MPKSDGSGQAGISPIPCLAMALAVAVVVMACSIGVFHVAYYINDDISIQFILSGAVSGVPEAHAIYPNVIVCQPVALLYGLSPNVNWYLIALEAGMFLAVAGLSYVTIRMTSSAFPRRYGSAVRAVVSAGSALVVSACLLWTRIVCPHYSIEAAVLAGVGCCLYAVGYSSGAVSTFERRVLAVAAVAFELLAFCVRYQSGLVGVGFLGLMAFMHAFGLFRSASAGERVRKTLATLVPGIAAIALCAAAWGVNAVAYSSGEWKEFGAFNEARTAFFDYGRASFEDEPQRYEELGWNSPLVDMVDVWFLMDDRVTADTLEALSTGDVVKRYNPITTFVEDRKAFDNPLIAAHIALMLVLCVVCAALGSCKRGRWRPAVLVAFSFALIGYLAFSGRFLDRAVVCATFPALLVCWGYALALLPREGLARTAPADGPFAGCADDREIADALGADGKGGAGTASGKVPGLSILAFVVFAACFAALSLVVMRGGIGGRQNVVLLAIAIVTSAFIVYALRAHRTSRGAGVLQAGCAVLLLCLLVGVLPATSTSRHIKETEESDAKYAAIYDYARAHPSDVFVHSPGLTTVNPALTQPTNYIGWGGWSFAAPFREPVFSQLGYPGGIAGEELLDPSVYFVVSSGETLQKVEAYLGSVSDGNVSCRQVDKLAGGVGIYQFRR